MHAFIGNGIQPIRPIRFKAFPVVKGLAIKPVLFDVFQPGFYLAFAFLDLTLTSANMETCGGGVLMEALV
jgi:hypothetical protein